MSEIKKFPLNQVLIVLTGRLLGKMSEVYEILNYMTGDKIYTHQIGRALEAAEGRIEELEEENKRYVKAGGQLVEVLVDISKGATNDK